MNVLVTGCAGFIGSKVTEALLKDGHTVLGIDNLNTAYDPRLKKWRLDQIKDHKDFEFHKIDITDHSALSQLFIERSGNFNRYGSIDAVMNLAARAGVRQSVENPWVYFETNVTGTLNLLELCREHGIKKFVLASTSSLYGEHNPRPFQEDADTSRPLSPYAASKKAAETLCYTHHYLHGLDATILRFFTVYGPAGRPDMSIFRFIRWIAEGEPLMLYGDGSQERDFTYVEDIAKGVVASLGRLGFEIINLGSDNPNSLLEVIQEIQILVGKDAIIEYLPYQPTDVSATWADVAKASRLLLWKPSTSISVGLRQTVEWYEKNRSLANKLDLGEV